MKKILFFLSIFMIVFGIYSIQEYFSYIGPQLAINQAIKNDIERVRLEKEQLDYEHEVNEKQIRREVVTNTFPYALITIFIIVIGTSVIFLYIRYDKRKESWYRQVDGSFALQDMVVNGVKWKVDINKSPSGAIGVAPNGQLLLAPVDESFGPDRQLNYNNKIQNTRTAEAITSSDAGIQNAATGKFLAGAYDRNQKQLTVRDEKQNEETIDVEPVKLLSLQDAIAQSNKTRWIIGQDAEGNLSEVNIREIIHIGILGASNCGKTSSTALLLSYYARKSGMDVIVLDSKGLTDWRIYSEIFDVHLTNSENFVHYLRQIGDMYSSRKKIVSKLNIESFYDSNEHGLKPTLIILEEFGKLSDELRTKDRKQYEIIMKAIGNILRDCRAVGMHFCFVDQTVVNFNPNIKALIKYWVCYKLEAYSGKAINFHHLDKLKNVGQFASSDNKMGQYNAWHTKSLINVKTLLKPMKYKLLTDSVKPTEFVDPLRGVTDDEPQYHVVEEEETTNEVKITNKRYYEDLTESDKKLIRDLFSEGNSLRTITKAIFAGQWGKFYNDIVKRVLQEE
jgi:hypothetical protein